jgi:acetylglutamate kinase
MSTSTAVTTPEVVKVGGAELGLLSGLWQELKGTGPRVVVHGGGAAITAAGGGQARFLRGRRVTDLATARVAAEVLGQLGEALQAEAAANGVPVTRFLAGEGGPGPLVPLDEAAYGRVGVPGAVDREAFLDCLAQGLTVLVTPVGRYEDGEWLNVNADDMASALAAALGIPFLSFTDVPGVLVGGRVRRRLAAEEAEALIASGEIQGGMVAKVEAALAAVAHGAPFAWIGPLAAVEPIAKARQGDTGTTIGGGPKA